MTCAVFSDYMDEHHHENLIEGVSKEYKDILENSKQGVYLYLDDAHKVCNEKFASLLGYESAEEWAEVSGSFPDAFVAEESQEELVTSYQEAMENFIGSVIKVAWKKKSGGTVSTNVILVPISQDGHLLALHFVSK